MKVVNNENLKRKSGVYQIENSLDNRVYIGSSKRLFDRYLQHINTLESKIHSNPFLQEFYNTYGMEFLSFRILECCDKVDLKTKEQFYLNNAKELFNIAKFAYSAKGVLLSQQSKDKISKSRIGIARSYETKCKIQTGHSKDMKPVIQYDKNMNFIEKYESLSEASRITKIDLGAISRVCNKLNYKTAGGYNWEFEEKDNWFTRLPCSKNTM